MAIGSESSAARSSILIVSFPLSHRIDDGFVHWFPSRDLWPRLRLLDAEAVFQADTGGSISEIPKNWPLAP